MTSTNVDKDTVCCPFNDAHKMPRKTLILHLTRCPDKKKNQSVCPYNNIHVVDSKCIEEHKRQCSDRCKFENILTKDNEVNMNTFDYNVCPDETTESTWDDDDLDNVQDVQSIQGLSINRLTNNGNKIS